jgi:hypothetical protein
MFPIWEDEIACTINQIVFGSLSLDRSTPWKHNLVDNMKEGIRQNTYSSSFERFKKIHYK